MSRRLRDPLVALAVAAAPWAAVGGLRRLGSQPWLRVDWSDLGTWARITPLEDAIAAGLRSVALLAAWWLALSTTLYLAALASRIPRLVAAARPFTLPAVRRIADRALAGTIAVSTLAAPLVGSTAEPIDPGFLPVPAVTAPAPAPLPAAPYPPHPEPAAAAVPPGSPTTAGGVEVRPERATVDPGDNLWLISERTLAGALGRDPSEREIASYWRLVVDENRDRLRSGDPDLIYPGEVVVLPPLP